MNALDVNASTLRAARKVIRHTAPARSRTEFADLLIPGLASLVGADTTFLVILDRRTRRPTIFGGTPEIRLRLGRRLRSRPRGFSAIRIGLDELGIETGDTLTLPLSSGVLEEGVLVVSRDIPFQADEVELLAHVLEASVPHLQLVYLHEQLDEAYEELREAQDSLGRNERVRTLGQMAAGVAHDIRNAMSPITAFSSMLLEVGDLHQEDRRYVELIQRAGDDVVHILSRMNEFHSGRSGGSMQPIELDLLLEQVRELTRPSWSGGGIRGGGEISLVVEASEDVPLLFGTPSALRELLTNLVMNSVDAMEGGGTIHLRAVEVPAPADSRGRRVAIEVSDDGEGMDEETRRRCLDPFFTTKGADGSGLGLAQAHRITQDHAGRFHVDSEEGIGTTIRLVFPAYESTGERTEHHDDVIERADVLPLRLLCIDDDEDHLQLLLHLLETDGHEVSIAAGGREGIEAFVRRQREGDAFDAVLTDLGMPDIDGRAVVASIRDASPDTPILVLTGWDPELRSELLPDEVFRVLKKPLQPGLLRQALHVIGKSED